MPCPSWACHRRSGILELPLADLRVGVKCHEVLHSARTGCRSLLPDEGVTTPPFSPVYRRLLVLGATCFKYSIPTLDRECPWSSERL